MGQGKNVILRATRRRSELGKYVTHFLHTVSMNNVERVQCQVVKKDDKDLTREREKDVLYPSCHCHAKFSTETELRGKAM